MKWAGLLLLLMPGLALAQRGRESHAPLPPARAEMSPNELVQQRLGEQGTQQLLQQIRQRGGQPSADEMRRLRQNPLFARVMQQIADGDPQMMALIEHLAKSHPELRGLDPKILREQLPGLARQAMTGQPAPPPITRPRTPAERGQRSQQLAAERINDLLRDWKLDGMSEQFRDSPALQNFMRDLASRDGPLLAEPGTYNLPDLDWQAIGGWMRDLKQYLPKDMPVLPSLGPNDFSQRIPEFRFGGVSIPSGPEMGDFGEGWSAYFALAVVAVGVFAMWRYARKVGTKTTAQTQRVSWPSPPEQVTSLAEFIRAFEYVVLTKLGIDAVHWHHRRMADKLPATADAATLAHLYERARYAPVCAPPSNWEPIRAALARLSGGQA